ELSAHNVPQSGEFCNERRAAKLIAFIPLGHVSDQRVTKLSNIDLAVHVRISVRPNLREASHAAFTACRKAIEEQMVAMDGKSRRLCGALSQCDPRDSVQLAVAQARAGSNSELKRDLLVGVTGVFGKILTDCFNIITNRSKA